MYGGRTEPNLCRHRFMNVDLLVVRRAQNGYAARCLLCNRVRLVRDYGESARLALLEQRACDGK
jgi:hypothetical protein